MSLRVLGATCALGSLALSGCSSTPVRTALPTAGTAAATPTTVPSVLTAQERGRLRGALSGRRYERAVLADRPVGLWPLVTDDVTLSLTGPAGDARLGGPEPQAVTGPVLRGEGRPASHFDGATFVSTPVALGSAAAPQWSLEFWYMPDACGTAYRQIASTAASRTRATRTGINVFAYPKEARTPCRVGAEIWQDGTFRGGCAQPSTSAPGWHHYVITRGPTSLSCWVDGVPANRGTVTAALPAGSDRWGIGDSAAGTDPGARVVGGLADVALYDRVLPAATIAAHARTR